ncbi:MAG: hypothetical protein M3Z25_02095 [Actinomycetota bacterium]|nr:hypothetical protein [Actinomycetota bacterium]
MAISDLSRWGIDPPPDGLRTNHQRTGQVPTFDDGRLVSAVKAREIEVVPAVEGFDATGALLRGGSRIEVDAVIAATGYRRDLERLVGQHGVLDQVGHPTVHGAQTKPGAPGLYFLGFTDPFTGNLRAIRLDAERIARDIVAQADDP